MRYASLGQPPSPLNIPEVLHSSQINMPFSTSLTFWHVKHFFRTWVPRSILRSSIFFCSLEETIGRTHACLSEQRGASLLPSLVAHSPRDRKSNPRLGQLSSVTVQVPRPVLRRAWPPCPASCRSCRRNKTRIDICDGQAHLTDRQAPALRRCKRRSETAGLLRGSLSRRRRPPDRPWALLSPRSIRRWRGRRAQRQPLPALPAILLKVATLVLVLGPRQVA